MMTRRSALDHVTATGGCVGYDDDIFDIDDCDVGGEPEARELIEPYISKGSLERWTRDLCAARHDPATVETSLIGILATVVDQVIADNEAAKRRLLKKRAQAAAKG